MAEGLVCRVWLWFVGVAAFAWAGVASGHDLRYPPTPAAREELIGKGWAAAGEELGPLLKAAYSPGLAERPGSTGMKAFRQWLGLWKWCELLSRSEREEAVALFRRHLRAKPGSERLVLLPPGVVAEEGLEEVEAGVAERHFDNPRLRHELLATLIPGHIPDPGDQPLSARLDPALAIEWANDPEFTEAFFSTLSALDYAPGVLRNLAQIREAHPRKFREYAGLALAVAVVYDQKSPKFWPHHQVERPLVPVAEVLPAEWFGAWVAANESGALWNDLRAMKPGFLKYLIDAPLSESEYAWARKNAKFPRADFGRAFSSVPYSDARLKAAEYTWKEPDYTLANILARGGICVDQAYFAWICGKARGLPTLFFSGQGSDGGHAWFGYLKPGDRWELNAGRYENQNYAIGEALDPQTWQPISDHELKSLAEGFRERPAYQASRDDLVLAALFEELGDTALAARAYESAVSVCPRSPEAWEARGIFLSLTGAPADVRRAFHEAAIKQFSTQRDLRARHQLALAGIEREEGNIEAAMAIERRIVSQNRLRRADLSVGAAARRLALLVDDGKTDEAFSEYRRLLARLRETGGGNLFYDIVAPFTAYLAGAGDARRALQASEMARKALNPTPDSILAREFDQLDEDLGGGVARRP